MLDEHPPHGLGCGDVEVSEVFPGDITWPHKADIGLVNQSGGLQRVVATLPSHLLLGRSPELLVDEGKELVCREAIAPADFFQDPADVWRFRFGRDGPFHHRH